MSDAVPPGFFPVQSNEAIPPGFFPVQTSDPNTVWSDLKKYGPGFLTENARKFGASAMSVWNQGLRSAGTLAAPGTIVNQLPIVGPVLSGLRTAQQLTTGDWQPTIDKLDVPNQAVPGTWEDYMDRMMRAGGSAAATPIGGIGNLVTNGVRALPGFVAKQFFQNVVPAEVGGVAGLKARNIAADAGVQNPYALAGIDMAGNFIAGGGSGMLVAPRQPPAMQDIRRSLDGLSPQDFADALLRQEQFRNAGSTTATAAEAFGPGTPILDLARRTQAGPIDNRLRQLIGGRDADLRNLGQTFLGRLNPNGPVDPGVVANQATDAANGILRNLTDQRNQIINGRQMALGPINPMHVADVETQLNALAEQQTTNEAAAAYRNVAARLRQNGNVLTDPRMISIELANEQQRFANPSAPVQSNQAVSNAVDTTSAVNAARALIDQYAPGFHGATFHFGNFTNDIIQPFRQSAVGTLLDANPVTARITDPGKLGRLVDLTPTEVDSNAAMLNDPAITGGPTVHPLDIATALAQPAVGMGERAPLDVGAAVNGIGGNNSGYNTIEQLVRAGGADPAEVMAPLHAADNLQSLSSGAPIVEFPKMSLFQLIRPFRTLDMWGTGNTVTSTQQQLAELLAARDSGALARLQDIANFNPRIRQGLVAKTILNPVLDGIAPTGSDQGGQ